MWLLKHERVTSGLGFYQTRSIRKMVKAPEQQIIGFNHDGRQARVTQH
jgi:hypothetical protein